MIHKILERLKEADRVQLELAHQLNQQKYIIYDTGRFIGVNVAGVPNIRVTEAVGNWAIGEISDGAIE